MLRLSRLACLLGVFALAAPTFAQNVTLVTPTAAAVGTTLEITGTGFGTAKPKVQLFDTATSKKYALKVVDNSDTVIHATIAKAVEGDLQLQVIVKGAAAPANGPANISIERPLVTSLSVSSATPEAPLTVHGDFFGNKKGTILINGQKAKVLTWVMDKIELLMPKKLPNGFWNIVVDNKLGHDDSATIQVTGSTVKIGKATLNAKINGNTLKLKYGAGAAPGGYGVVAVGSNGGYPSGVAFAVAVPFTDGGAVPAQYVWGPNIFVVTYVEYKATKPVPTVSAFIPTNGFTVHITANSAGQVAGTFSGTLANQANPQDTVTCDGDFIVDYINN